MTGTINRQRQIILGAKFCLGVIGGFCTKGHSFLAGGRGLLRCFILRRRLACTGTLHLTFGEEDKPHDQDRCNQLLPHRELGKLVGLLGFLIIFFRNDRFQGLQFVAVCVGLRRLFRGRRTKVNGGLCALAGAVLSWLFTCEVANPRADLIDEVLQGRFFFVVAHGLISQYRQIGWCFFGPATWSDLDAFLVARDQHSVLHPCRNINTALNDRRVPGEPIACTHLSLQICEDLCDAFLVSAALEFGFGGVEGLNRLGLLLDDRFARFVLRRTSCERGECGYRREGFKQLD
ncbi:hypothetical protein PA12_pgene98 (plasmid) [Pseudomonas aeruginosa]|nr:hypothetical protein PA12_pgene98 [Pseudomonas aeruginosa]